ncbi:MAG: RNA polymerase sigma factor [Clostridia bacterium]|nr:RNA polymerase sigma factor [Clostridia bacterium]
MKKQELLKIIDDALLEKLFAFCYARTSDSYEAQDLCSDILFALIRAAHTDGDIENVYPFIWRVARNVYADFSNERSRHAAMLYAGDADEVLPFIADAGCDEDDEARFSAIYRRIAFLTKAYREVMILFYIDGLPIAEIAKRQNTSEGAVRQRLFSARQKVKSEVEEMAETYTKPVALDKIEYVIWGTGSPAWGDPRNVCKRQFSKHIIWLCRKKPMRAAEIAAELNVPTVYVEEELEILTKGENGKYGFLRRLEDGRYTINIVLLEKDVMEQANAIYTEQLPMICDTIAQFIEQHKAEYLAFPYLNKKIDLNLILWQQVVMMASALSENVEKILSEKYFAQVEETKRPFSVFGYVDNGKYYGGGWDGVDAENVCGYSKIHLDNIYITRIKKHFSCGLNVSRDAQIQLAIRAIHGLDIHTLPEKEKEHAAKAVDCGYLYRDGEMLYTKILVCDGKDADSLYDISEKLRENFAVDAEGVAAKIAALIRHVVPEHLLGEWRRANTLAGMPVTDALVEALIEKGILIPPKDGIGAEGCWMSVEK